jgi:putative oxidoreductase
MLVAAYTVHRPNGFFSVRSGWEYNLILALIGATLGFTGSGRFSPDRTLGLDALLPAFAGGLIATVGGVLTGIGQLAIFYRPPVRQVADAA